MRFFDYSFTLMVALLVLVLLIYLLVIFYIFQRRDQKLKFNKEFVYSTFIYCTTNINLGHEWDIVNLQNNDEFKDKRDKSYEKDNKHFYSEEYDSAVLKIFYTFNSLSVGIQSGGLDNNTVYWLMGQDMQLFFKTHKFALTKIRNKVNNPYLYINYEMMIAEWEEQNIEDKLIELNAKKRAFL